LPLFQRRQFFDAEYAAGDDFDMSDLVGSLKREAPPRVVPLLMSSSSASRASLPPQEGGGSGSNDPVISGSEGRGSANCHNSAVDPEAEEERLVRRLNLDAPRPATNPIVKSAGRIPGESKNAFRKRAMAETRQIIKRTRMEQTNPEKKLRKKEFLNNKKLKKKNGAGNNSHSRESMLQRSIGGFGDDDIPVFTGYGSDGSSRERETRVVFGEQVEAPPVFRQRPRGAPDKKKMTMTGFDAGSSATTGSRSCNSKRSMSAEGITSEQKEVELILRKAQAHYSLVKVKRRKDGEFHL
jgi:hypothetical protein